MIDVSLPLVEIAFSSTTTVAGVKPELTTWLTAPSCTMNAEAWAFKLSVKFFVLRTDTTKSRALAAPEPLDGVSESDLDSVLSPPCASRSRRRISAYSNPPTTMNRRCSAIANGSSSSPATGAAPAPGSYPLSTGRTCTEPPRGALAAEYSTASAVTLQSSSAARTTMNELSVSPPSPQNGHFEFSRVSFDARSTSPAVPVHGEGSASGSGPANENVHSFLARSIRTYRFLPGQLES